jgi:mono/diheme cytochrome c family protein
MRTAAIIAGVVLFAVVVATAQGRTDLQGDQVSIRQGASVYAREGCAKCHFLAGKGGNASHPLDGVGTRLTAAEIRTVLVTPQARDGSRKPAKGMPSSARLKKPDLDALVAYLFSLKMLDTPR